MDEHTAQEILEKIEELAALIGWHAVIAQTAHGDILGMYLGPESWINYKEGRDVQKPSH